MIPERPLPFNGDFSSPDEYIETLLNFVKTSDTFQILCGGVHILDFFTSEPGLFRAGLPEEWQPYLLSGSVMQLVNLVAKDDLDHLETEDGRPKPPESLLEYVRNIRGLSMDRSFSAKKLKHPKLTQNMRLGMKPKKVHEVVNFADFVDRLSDDISSKSGTDITHFVDFGSGQNYLGRVLASEPYNKRVVAVEGRENNVAAAKGLDMNSGLAVKPKVMRNKKLWNRVLEARDRFPADDPDALKKAIAEVSGDDAFDFRSTQELDGVQQVAEGRGHVQYVSGRLDSGDLSDVVAKIDCDENGQRAEEGKEMKLMAMSIHSCGNLSHHGIRSIMLNPDIRAVAIVGCCYNLLTEKLGPPNYKHPYLRPTLQAANGRVFKESVKRDPHGFPMSGHFSTYRGDGIRFNITARMMACQALSNWTQADSEGFFKRHFFRAVLQKIFLDRGVVHKIRHDDAEEENEQGQSSSTSASSPPKPEPKPELSGADPATESPFNTSTRPIVIGSLRKGCYDTLGSYVRGAMDKLTSSTEYKQYGEVIEARMGDITDEEIARYEAEYAPRKKELSVMWTLMAFSATVVEALIAADRWAWLREQEGVVGDAWVETVFEYEQSPRNLVVVGVKKADA